jgi:hypothetical protein
MDVPRKDAALMANLDVLARRYVRSVNPAERQAATVLAALPVFIVAGRMGMVAAIIAALVGNRGQQVDVPPDDTGLIAEINTLAERYKRSDKPAEQQTAPVLVALPIFISTGQIDMVAAIMAALVEDQQHLEDARVARSRPS